jgi:UDP-glucose 4-epimerase
MADAPRNPRALNQVFNIGADSPYTIHTLAKMIASTMGVPMRVEYLPARNEVKHAFSDHKKLQETFGYTARVPLEEGVARMARWALSVGAKRSKPFAEVEIVKNMPPTWRAELSLVS